MALIHCDGADLYTGDPTALGKWTSQGNGGGGGSNMNATSGGRYGGNRLYANASAPYTGGAGDYLIWAIPSTLRTGPFVMGCALLNPYQNGLIMALSDASGTRQVDVRVSQPVGGTFYLQVVGNATIATSSVALPNPGSLWNYIEMKVTVHGSAGVVEVRQNGVTVIGPLTGLNTAAAGNNVVANFVLGASGGYGGYFTENVSYDDVYLLNADTGLNTFLGDVRIYGVLPTADGSHSVWTPNSGTVHYNRVNDNPNDGDSTYVSSNTVGALDSYAVGALPVAVSGIKAVVPQIVVRSADAGARTVQPLLRVNGLGTPESTPGIAVQPLSAYQLVRGVAETKPDGSAWLPGDWSNVEVGAKVVS